MPNVIGQRIKGNLVYVDDGAHSMRVVDAIGPDVIKYIAEPNHFQENAGTGTDPRGWTATVVEAGTGTSEVDASNAAGETFRIVTAAGENDGVNLQLNGESFELTADQVFYFGIEFKLSDATQTDVLAGICITDTTLLGGMTDGVYLEKLDGALTVSAVAEKNSTESQDDSLGTMADDTYMFWEFYWDGSTVYVFIDGAEVTTFVSTDNIPDDEALRLSLHFLTGEGNANTLTCRQLRAIQIGR